MKRFVTQTVKLDDNGGTVVFSGRSADGGVDDVRMETVTLFGVETDAYSLSDKLRQAIYYAATDMIDDYAWEEDE